VSGLLEAGQDALQRPLTIGAEPADKDQVLFMSVFTDEGGRQYPETTPEGEGPLVSALETIRSWMELTPSPWTDRFQRSEPDQGGSDSAARRSPPRGEAKSGGSASNPSGNSESSASRQNGQSRQKHESEKVYDQSSQASPTKKQAAQAVVAKARKHPEDTLAAEAQVNGTTLDVKLKGLTEYCGRDEGYVSRILDALQLHSLEQVAVGQVRTVVHMLLDEGVLQENESFEPDDQLPF